MRDRGKEPPFHVKSARPRRRTPRPACPRPQRSPWLRRNRSACPLGSPTAPRLSENCFAATRRFCWRTPGLTPRGRLPAWRLGNCGRREIRALTSFSRVLLNAGAEFVSYIPNNACLVRASADIAQGIAADPLVQSVIPYEPYYK